MKFFFICFLILFIFTNEALLNSQEGKSKKKGKSKRKNKRSKKQVLKEEKESKDEKDIKKTEMQTAEIKNSTSSSIDYEYLAVLTKKMKTYSELADIGIVLIEKSQNKLKNSFSSFRLNHHLNYEDYVFYLSHHYSKTSIIMKKINAMQDFLKQIHLLTTQILGMLDINDEKLDAARYELESIFERVLIQNALLSGVRTAVEKSRTLAQGGQNYFVMRLSEEKHMEQKRRSNILWHHFGKQTYHSRPNNLPEERNSKKEHTNFIQTEKTLESLSNKIKEDLIIDKQKMLKKKMRN